ncbi:MAG: hypothetical protein ABI164_11470, partial [Acidobacteriaceae bacterium]
MLVILIVNRQYRSAQRNRSVMYRTQTSKFLPVFHRQEEARDAVLRVKVSEQIPASSDSFQATYKMEDVRFLRMQVQGASALSFAYCEGWEAQIPVHRKSETAG